MARLALPSLVLLTMPVSVLAGQEPLAAASGQRPQALRLRPAGMELPEDPVVLPMRMRGVQPGVEVMVNGEGPFFFAIDTGGQGAARVDVSLRERLGLQAAGEVGGGDPTGRATTPMQVVELDSIQVGGARFTGVRALSRDYNRHGARLPHIDGILGCHLFSGCVLVLDFAERKVWIQRSPWEAPDGARALALTSEPDGVPAVRATLGDLVLDPLYLDTGKMGGLGVPAKAVEKLHFLEEPVVIGRGRTVTGEIEIRRGRAEGVFTCGGLRLENPPVEFSELLPVAILGSAALGSCVLVLDQPQRRVWIERMEDRTAR